MTDTMNVGRTPLLTEKLSDQVYRLLRDRITDGAIPPGARLRLDQLVDEFGISKMPLREAINGLERDRLVVTKPRSGTYVAVPRIADVIEICDLRCGIEWQAIQLATPRIADATLQELLDEIIAAEAQATSGDYAPFFESDRRLHQAIVDASGNQRLRDVRETIESYVRWFRILGATGTHRVHGSSLRHREIVVALQQRDANLASTLIATHIDEVKHWMVEDFARSSDTA